MKPSHLEIDMIDPAYYTVADGDGHATAAWTSLKPQDDEKLASSHEANSDTPEARCESF